ncbi:hypothetical protein Ahy_B10g102299 [Arachis hypogaea]|uniref:HAT C-terminal dimerisation domain-containing protein n=1 Tax=Arachis hypogaea TaxID=3818 RepID=A0A444X1G4_ARAHY|nr:hypothetical protein Ahy_B10g102299 [Arachis hypogaea]
MLESALKFQKAFKRLGERDSEYAMMAGGIPRSEDWENARHFVKFLKIFYDVTNQVSGSTFVTSSQHFNDFCKILSTLKHWMGSLDTVLSSMAEKMKSKYDKYWGNIKNTNMMIFIAVVLDPRYKLQLIKWSFEKLYEKEDAEFLTSKVKETLFRVFDSYRLFGGNYQRSTRQDPPENSTQELEAHETSFAMEFEKEMQFNESANKNEVELYLMEALEKSGVQFDILNWWKVNSTKFPILGQIARDVLAMPVSTVASESAFSTGGRVLNNYRSSLTPMIVEALICTQNWLRNSPKLVLEELIEELEKLELVEIAGGLTSLARLKAAMDREEASSASLSTPLSHPAADSRVISQEVISAGARVEARVSPGPVNLPEEELGEEQKRASDAESQAAVLLAEANSLKVEVAGSKAEVEALKKEKTELLADVKEAVMAAEETMRAEAQVLALGADVSVMGEFRVVQDGCIVDL